MHVVKSFHKKGWKKHDFFHSVVVKVMYPGVEDVFRGDVRTIKMFAQV